MSGVNSTFKATIVEFCEAANWITEKISSSKTIKDKPHDCVEEIQNRIDVLQPIAEKYDRSFRTCKMSMDEEAVIGLENAASCLWNSVSIALKIESDDELGPLLCRCKIFASYLLSIHEALRPSNDKKLRTFKCFISVLKIVADHSWIQLTKQLQENLDKSLRFLEECACSFSDVNSKSYRDLKFQYFLLNFQLSLIEGDLENARIYSSKADIDANLESLDPSLLLDLCRIIYNAALALRDKATEKHSNDVISLLKDVTRYLELPVSDLKTHVDYNSLRYSSLLLLTDSLIKQPDTDFINNDCQKYVNLLQNEYPKKAEPFCLSIDLASKRGSTTMIDEIDEILMRMITSIDIISNFDILVGCINEFSLMSTKKALMCLEYVFMNKLEAEKDQKWLERLLMCRFFITTQSKTFTDSDIVESLELFSDKAEKQLTRVISQTTMSVIVTLLWNSGKKLDKIEKFRESVGFYRLALRDVLSQAYLDRGKIQRALTSACINIENYSEAQKVLDEMNLIDKEHPLTQLLVLKIALTSEDSATALKCLEKIRYSEHEKSIDALIVAATQCKRSTDLAVKAMCFLFDALDQKRLPEKDCVPTLCLLRYTLQMLIKMAEDCVDGILTQYLETIRMLLTKGSEYLQKIKMIRLLGDNSNVDPKFQEVVSIDEIEWFASTAYNVAIKCLSENMHLKLNLECFAQLAVDYISMIPVQEFTFPKMLHYTYWRFKSSVLCLVISKESILAEDEKSLLVVRNKSLELMKEISQCKNNQDFQDSSDEKNVELIDECFIDALTLTYEISLSIRDQLKILDLVKMVGDLHDSQLEDSIISSTLCMQDLPNGLKVEVLHRIIDRNIANMHLEDYKLCSWLRNLLEPSLNMVSSMTRKLTERVLTRLIKSSTASNRHHNLLKQEAEMVATFCWNEGVRAIIKGDKIAGMSWCNNSIQFASLVNQALEGQLQTMWESLAASADLNPSLPLGDDTA